MASWWGVMYGIYLAMNKMSSMKERKETKDLPLVPR